MSTILVGVPVCFAGLSAGASWYLGIPFWKFGLGYTALATGVTALLSYMTTKIDVPGNFLLTFMAAGAGVVRIGVFWATLLALQGFRHMIQN